MDKVQLHLNSVVGVLLRHNHVEICTLGANLLATFIKVQVTYLDRSCLHQLPVPASTAALHSACHTSWWCPRSRAETYPCCGCALPFSMECSYWIDRVNY